MCSVQIKEELDPLYTTGTGEETSNEQKITTKKMSITNMKDTHSKNVSNKNDQATKVVEETIPKPELYCPICNKVFFMRCRLNRHALRHGQKKVKCDLCDSIFVSLEYMRIHKKAVHNEKKFTCDKCGKRYNTYNSLSTHMKRVHSVQRPKFKCEFCELKFASNTYMKHHIRTKHLGVSFLCEVCSKEFKDPRRFKLHVLSHDPTSRLKKCSVCNEEILTEKFDLHLAKHRKPRIIKQLDCEICGKSVKRNNMENHKRRHTGERPFACKFCDQKFIRKDTLKGHMVVHTKQKPYSCKYCEKAFTQRTPLVRHMKDMHDSHS